MDNIDQEVVSLLKAGASDSEIIEKLGVEQSKIDSLRSLAGEEKEEEKPAGEVNAPSQTTDTQPTDVGDSANAPSEEKGADVSGEEVADNNEAKAE